MEIRILTEAELANAAGLSRYVFDNCLRNRMEFVQTAAFVENYLKLENLTNLCAEGKLTVWGVWEKEQMVGVSGLQSDGMITMLYILPQCWKRGYGNALLAAMREFAKNTYGMQHVLVNATPAWTSTYFTRKGFAYMQPHQNMHVPFVSMCATTNDAQIFQKKRVSGKVIGLAIAGCFLFATIAGIAFLISYVL